MTSKPDSLDRNKTGVLTFLVRKIATLCFAALMFVVTPVFADAKKDAAKAQEELAYALGAQAYLFGQQRTQSLETKSISNIIGQS
jgi:hypothetical protein